MTTAQRPAGWRETTLGEVCEFQRGFDLPTKDRTIGEYPLVVSNGIDGFINEYKVIGPGVVTGRSGTLGNVIYIKDNFWPLNTTLWIKNFHNNDRKFIYYRLLKFPFEKYNAGSGVPTLNRNHIHEVLVKIPPLPEQIAIASLLSSFDDKIELLREQNKTLEQLGQTIFQEWFGKYSVDESDSLPEGWRVGKITEIIKREPVSYKCDKKDLDPNGHTPIIDQGATGLYGYTSRDPDFIASRENPVILFTNHTCNYRFIDYPFCAIQNVLPYRGIDGYDQYFLYFMTKGSITFIEYKGHRPDFEAKDFIIPTVEKTQEFSKIAKPILQKISDNNLQIQSLSASRDTLLPKLMSGEVRMGF